MLTVFLFLYYIMFIALSGEEFLQSYLISSRDSKLGLDNTKKKYDVRPKYKSPNINVFDWGLPEVCLILQFFSIEFVFYSVATSFWYLFGN